MGTKNFIGAIVLLCLGLFYLFASLPYERGSMRNPGPGLFPIFIAIALIGCGGLLMVTSIIGEKKGEKLNEIWKGLAPRNISSAAMMVGGIILYLFIIDALGFLLSSAMLMIFLAWLMGGRRRIINMAVGLVSVGILYWLFWVIMRVPLPQGTLWR